MTSEELPEERQHDVVELVRLAHVHDVIGLRDLHQPAFGITSASWLQIRLVQGGS
jgi:hypothetical protein